MPTEVTQMAVLLHQLHLIKLQPPRMDGQERIGHVMHVGDVKVDV